MTPFIGINTDNLFLAHIIMSNIHKAEIVGNKVIVTATWCGIGRGGEDGGTLYDIKMPQGAKAELPVEAYHKLGALIAEWNRAHYEGMRIQYPNMPFFEEHGHQCAAPSGSPEFSQEEADLAFAADMTVESNEEQTWPFAPLPNNLYAIFHATEQGKRFEEIVDQPRDYVGTVWARSYQDAFTKSQHIEGSMWYENARSTSVGDVIMMNWETYMVTGTGFQRTPELDEPYSLMVKKGPDYNKAS